MSDRERRALPEGVEWPMVDGKPVMPGNRLTDLGDGETFTVVEVRFGEAPGCDGGVEFSIVGIMDDGGIFVGFDTDGLTRTEPPKPVLDRDGVPIEVGQEVWDESGENWIVSDVLPSNAPFSVEVTARGYVTRVDPARITHERPDSWGRLEKDAGKGACDYFGSSEFSCKECHFFGREHDCSGLMAMDIVRRAKALAGVGADE